MLTNIRKPGRSVGLRFQSLKGFPGHSDKRKYKLGIFAYYHPVLGKKTRPSEIRTNLLKLHGLAMNVVNNRWTAS